MKVNAPYNIAASNAGGLNLASSALTRHSTSTSSSFTTLQKTYYNIGAGTRSFLKQPRKHLRDIYLAGSRSWAAARRSQKMACQESGINEAAANELASSYVSGNDDKLVKPSVVIVGGGLGGLAAAVALRSRGIDAQVYEKNPAVTGGEGTMISLFPNGVWALSHSDSSLVSKLKEAGVCDPTCLNYSPDGSKLLGQWEIASHMEATYGFPMVAIRWQRVLKILCHSLPPKCVHTGHDLVGLSQDADNVTATFLTSSGTKDIQANLVVGADGIRSKVRELLIGPRPPNDNGRGIWRAIIPFDRCSHPLMRPGHIVASVGEGRTATICDAGHNALYWAYTVTDGFRGARRRGRSRDGAEAQELLRADFKGWDLALHVLEMTEPEAILERRVVDMPVLSQWAYGRVALLGDAAHALTPALGQGANLAFEDGLELACQLSTAPSLEAALDKYETIRIPRARAVAAQNVGGSAKIYKDEKTNVEPTNFYDFLYAYRGQGTFQQAVGDVEPWLAQS